MAGSWYSKADPETLPLIYSYTGFDIKECSTVPGSACDILVHHEIFAVTANTEDQMICEEGGSGTI